MKVIIVGGGNTGLLLAERLSEGYHQVIIIEKDQNRADEIRGDLDGTVIQGNGAEMEVLENAGAENVDALAAVTGDDNVNLMTVTIAKKLEVPNIITRLNDTKNAELFEDIEINAIIGSSETASVDMFEKTIVGGGMYGKLGLSIDEANATEVTVLKGSKAEGLEIKNLDMPELCTVSLIVRNDELIPVRGNTELKVDDRVVLVGKSEDVLSATELFRGN